MGWAKGKGLGREEQGDLEPIRLKYKNDAEGIGFEVNDDQWVAHREEFNNILEALNGNNSLLNVSDTVPVQSLEDRSKSSKARVHYHKFTRGKDLSRYSAADMACILGKRPKSETEQGMKEVKIKEEPIEESTNGSVEHKHGVTTIQRGSIQEYFESKMAAAKEKQRQYLANCKQEDSGNEGSSNCDDHEKYERRVRINEDLNVIKEFHSKDKILKTEKTDIKDVTVTNEIVDETRPKKRKKESKTKVEEESECISSEPLPVNGEVMGNPEIKIKKKKKKDVEKDIPEPVVEAEPVKSKKSKRTKIEETASTTTEVIQNGEENHTQEELKKKKKKAKKQEEEVIIECKPIIQNGEADSTEQERKKKKKKSKKQEEKVTEASSIEVMEPVQKKSKKNKAVEVSVEQVQDAEDVPPPAKKKKNKSKKDEQEVAEKYTKMNDSCIEVMQTEHINASEKMQNVSEQDTEQKTKNKKSKRTGEVPETFRKMENSFQEIESKLDEKNQNKTDKIQVESIVNELDIRVSKKNKKNKESAIVVPEEDAEVNSPKKKAKKRKACDKIDEIVINGKEHVGCKLANKVEETKNIDKKACSADQLTCQADAKLDDSGKEVDQTPKENISTILIEAGVTQDSKMLESVQLNNGSRLSQKLNRKLMRAKFDMFVGK